MHTHQDTRKAVCVCVFDCSFSSLPHLSQLIKVQHTHTQYKWTKGKTEPRRKRKMCRAQINYNNNDAKHDNNKWQWGFNGGFAGALREGIWPRAAGDGRLLLIIAIFCALSRRKSSQTYAAVTDEIGEGLKICGGAHKNKIHLRSVKIIQ